MCGFNNVMNYNGAAKPECSNLITEWDWGKIKQRELKIEASFIRQ